MSNMQPISLFLDEQLVDELWTLAKREGIEIETKLGAKAKFGAGKLWQWMTAELKAELQGEGSGKFSRKLQITSVFRALVLPELIKDIARVGNGDSTSIDELEHGDFLEVQASTLELTPLPTFAAYIRQIAILGVGNEQEGKSELGFDQTVSFAEKITSAQRALTFCLRVEGDSRSSLLQQLFSEESEELFNALCMSNDDHVLALSSFSADGSDFTVFAVLDECYLKRNLAVFTVARPINIFGRVAYLDRTRNLLGVQPISISLI